MKSKKRRGSQPVFAKCSTLLQHSFAESTVPWRKKGTQFPVHITLPVSFVPYAITLVVNHQSQMTNKQKLNCAISHLYLTDCADVEEYRLSVRGDIVEWFAAMRDSNCADWLIIVDTCRARENKTRATLLEKLRTDFTKYANKIIEVDTHTSKTPTLVRSVRDLLVHSLDSLVVTYENYLQTEKEKCYSTEWNYIEYFDSQVALSQLYQGLGLEEHVLAQYDELEALLSVLISKYSVASQDSLPLWLSRLYGNPSHCPSLLHFAKNVNASLVSTTLTLLDLRTLLLSRQLQSLFDQCAIKAQNAPSSAYQIQFCAMILKYSYRFLATFTEELNILQIFELGGFCGLVPGTERTGAQLQKCADLISWLPNNTLEMDGFVQGEELSPVAKLKSILGSQDTFGHFIQKFHESAMAVMKHFSWKRQSRWLGKQLADFLILADRTEGALPYYLKLLNGLAKDGWYQAYVWLLEEVITHFESMSDLYHSILPEFYCHLSTSGHSESCRQKYGEKLEYMVKDHSRNLSPVKLVERHADNSPVVINHKNWLQIVPSFAILGQTIKCRLKVLSRLALPLDDLTVRLYWRRINEGESLGTDDLHFDLNIKGDLARVSCNAGVHRILAPRPSDASATSPDARTSFMFSESLAQLTPGHNDLSISGKVDELGYFVAVRLELIVNWLIICIPFDIFLLPKCLSLLHVKTEQPYVHLIPLDEPLFSGIAQRLKLVISPGTEQIEGSSILVSGVEGSALVEFQNDNRWCNQVVFDLPSLPPLQVHTITDIFVCCFLECLKDDASVKARIKIHWLNRVWTYELLFQPILYLNPRFLVLEDSVLLEVTISRCAGAMNLFATKTSLTEIKDSNDENQCASEPELINGEIGSLLPESVHRLLWRLPIYTRKEKTTEPNEFVLELWYKNIDDNINIREYCYRDRLLLTDEWAEYELCCQISSSALLCRAESPCDMIISLRSLTPDRRTENVLVCLAADTNLWRIEDTQKLVPVKESGLGQIAFTVIPKIMGYLPFPAVDLKRWTGISEADMYPVRCYVRTKGKQVHVLGPLHKPVLLGPIRKSKDRPVSMDF